MDILINTLLLVSTGALFAIRIGISKKYEGVNGNSLGSSFIFTTFFSIFAAIFLFCVNGFKIEFSWFSFVFAALLAIIEITAALLAIKILANGSPFIYTLFLLAGEVSLPFIYGACIGENISAFRIVGAFLAVFCAAYPIIFAKQKDKSKTKVVFYVLCVLALLLDGFTGITIELHGNQDFVGLFNSSAIDPKILSFTYFCFMAVLSPICYGIWRVKNKPVTKEGKPFVNKWLFIYAVFYSIIGATASLLNLVCADNPTIPASVQFGLISCSQIIVSALISWLVFHEKFDKTTMFQIITALIGGILLMF